MRRVLIILAIFFSSASVLAEDRLRADDAIIAGTFKALAKAFVALVDIHKLKENNVFKIRKMDEEKFAKRWSKAYAVIKELPQGLKSQYGIKENMPKKNAIALVASLDKRKIRAIIDALPDSLIAGQFRQYLALKKQNPQNNNLVAQINNFWVKIVSKSGSNIPAKTAK